MDNYPMLWLTERKEMLGCSVGRTRHPAGHGRTQEANTTQFYDG